MGPILKRLFDKISQRHDHPPQIPQPDHDIGAGNRFDRAELAFDDYLILDPDRLGHRDLNSGQQIAQHRPGCETEDDAGSPGRGEEADAVLPHRVESHQRDRDGEDHQQSFRDPLQDAHLGHMLAGEQIVGDVGPVTAQINLHADVERDRGGPAQRQDETHQQALADRPGHRAREVCAGQRDARNDDDDDHARRALTARQQRLEKRAIPARQSDQPAIEPSVNQQRDERWHHHRDDTD